MSDGHIGNGEGCGAAGVAVALTDFVAEMVAYDRLPRVIRDALKNLNGDMSAVGILPHYQAGISAQALCEAIRETDRENTATVQLHHFGELLPA